MNTIELQPVSMDTWGKKYRLLDKHGSPIDWEVSDTLHRVATELASVELPRKRAKMYQSFMEALELGALPAGRILSNAGAAEHKKAVSTINCVVSDTIPDSMDGILGKLVEAGMSLKSGCGIGYEFSTLRPRGSFVHGAGSTTSGPLSFMDIYDKACFTVSSAGGRRGAQMATFDIQHPDVLEFIRAKRTDGVLRQFNLSLLITDEFMAAVNNNTDWQFMWDGKPHGTPMKARELWDTVMTSNYNFAEPGFLLVDRLNRFNNLWFCENLRATNPCVTGSTLLLTIDGNVRIDSRVGQETEIWNGFEWSVVVPEITGKDQEIYDIEFSDGSKLPCTPYHKFVLNSGDRIEAKNLKLGMKLSKFNFPVIEGTKSIRSDVAYTQGFYSGDGQKDTKRIWLYEEKCDLIPYMALSAYSDQSNSSRNNRIMATMDKEPMDKDFVPSVRYTIRTRLDWLAGLMDSDGSVSGDGVVQIWSCDRDFLLNVKYMLNTLGASCTLLLGNDAHTKLMPADSGMDGHSAEYSVREGWRLCVSATHIVTLRDLGLTTRRLDISYTPQRDASRFIQPTFIRKRKKTEALVYCFNEPKNHTGVFNGIMTANCGEQPLPPYGACLLGSINIVKFVRDPFTRFSSFDWSGFDNVIRVFTRMLDNVVELSGLPLEQQRQELLRKRRHGMGYTGLGSAMALLNIKYGSPESIEFTERVTKRLAIVGFETGAELAREKGEAPVLQEQFTYDQIRPYSKFNTNLTGFKGARTGRQLLLKSHYFDQWHDDPDCKPAMDALKKYGSRFSHHSSIAPTGTISLSLGNNISSGVEPTFAHSYSRNIIRAGRNVKENVPVMSFEYLAYKVLVNTDAVAEVHPTESYPGELPQQDNRLPSAFVTTDDLTPNQHIDIQAAAQKWIDSSISKTINVPTDTTLEEFKNIYLYAYKKGLKGCTAFRFNPEAFQGVLVKHADLQNTNYLFNLEDGTSVTLSGDTEVEYLGQTQTAANLFDAIKEGFFGKL